jgi:phosphoribosylglycinamide formyltransferase 2
MGVALATADDVETARARALEAAGKVKPVSGKLREKAQRIYK